MEPPLSQGEVTLVLPRDGSRALYHGVIEQPLANGAAFDIAIEDNPDHSFQRRDRVVLVALRGDSRFAAEAIVVATRDETVIRAQVLSPWRFIERRLFPRFETSMRVQLTPGDSDDFADARVLDMSSGGMRIAVDRPFAGAIDVIVHGRDGIRIPCEVIASKRTGQEFEVRMSFRALSAAQRRFVQDVVSALQTLSERGRNLLAS